MREALEEGYVNYSTSLEILQQMRNELGITDDEHREVLSELGIEDPELLNPDRQRSLENQIRLSGYRKSLERLMLLQNTDGLQQQSAVKALQQQYSITPQEESWILSGLSQEAGIVRRALFLLEQLPNLIACHRALNQPILQEQKAALMMLQESTYHKKELIIRSFLEILETLNNDPAAITLAQSLARLAPMALSQLLEVENWRQRLNPIVLQHLTQPGEKPLTCSIESLRHLFPCS
ncbi:cyclic nucleotide-binding protein [Calothrix sp. NIES-4071]|nr:cyclic nucleotide-binding protein [Calothrix sp. NIES-4071]BAZ55348.1 cyclic nucleotide-binding protein [Calothrix sp. NIES-4105]